MFPSDQDSELDEFLLQISSSSYQQNTISQDLNHLMLAQATNPCKNTNNMHIPKSPHPQPHFDTLKIDSHAKKTMHRDIERQRRQEMATLHASLRNLLPFEYVKGKRSISDHMQEAVNYIKDLQKNVKELGAKRDELKKVSNLSHKVGPRSENPNNCMPSRVMVSSCLFGVEVVVNTSMNEPVLQLSRILEMLLKEGLNVVSCISTTVNDSVIHIIQSEVSDKASINMSELQNKLIDEACNSIIK